MADDLFSLADLVTINDRNLADINVSDLFDDAPLIRTLAATTASNGTLHKYVKQTGAPVVGFRTVNTGKDYDSSVDTLVTVTLKYLDAGVVMDKAIASGYKDGRDALLAREVMRHLRAAYFEAEEQLINGTGNDADGFSGIYDSLNALSSDFVIDAGGAPDTNPTGLSSVILLRSVSDLSHVAVVAGNEGMIDVGEAYSTQAVDASGDMFGAWAVDVAAWMGLQVGSANSIARIANIDDAGSKCTDALIYSALQQFAAAQQPTHIVMGRRSLEQLRQSRTATNATGAPAPRPTEVEGIPIVVTDAIGTGESEVN